MKLIMLGTGTLVPEAGRGSAALALQLSVGSTLLFDCGRGTLQKMKDCGLDPLALEDVYLSHLHPDHSAELVSLLFALNYAPKADLKKVLHITAPLGLGELVQSLFKSWRWLKPRYNLELREILHDKGFLELPSTAGEAVSVRGIFLEHGSMLNLGYRVEENGRSFAYTGDTGPCEHLLRLAGGVDCLVSECSFLDEEAVDSHMSPSTLGRLAQTAGVSRLVLSHIYPHIDREELRDKVAAIYHGEILLAEDSLTISI